MAHDTYWIKSPNVYCVCIVCVCAQVCSTPQSRVEKLNVDLGKILVYIQLIKTSDQICYTQNIDICITVISQKSHLHKQFIKIKYLL